MTRVEFIDACVANGFDITDDETGFLVRWTMCPVEDEAVHVDFEILPTLDWEVFVRFLKNGRDVSGVSRICGYFSYIKNWNPSKIGELRDRRKGQYSLERVKQEKGKIHV